jgi:hypothetical protein
MRPAGGRYPSLPRGIPCPIALKRGSEVRARGVFSRGPAALLCLLFLVFFPTSAWSQRTPPTPPSAGSASSGSIVGSSSGSTAGAPDVRLAPSARGIALRDLDTLQRCAVREGPSPETTLQRLRTLYLLAVEDRGQLATAWDVHRTLVEGAARGRLSLRSGVLEGYRGALLALEAKHGFWPHARVRDLRAALAILDVQVASTPEDPEVRYLRLVSTAFLPGLFGRQGTADQDLAALAQGLPAHVQRFPLRTWVAMADTVGELLARGPEGAGSSPNGGGATMLRGLEQARRQAEAAQIPLAPGCRGEDLSPS